MTFTRTRIGIENHHIFTGSTFTLYLEGSSDGDPTRAVDIAFWREFFHHYYPNERISFQQLGGKPHVLDMARKIKEGSIKNSLCAVDSDYDFITPVPREDRIFRTFGYGVENDVYREFVFVGLVRAMLPGLQDPAAQASLIWGYVQSAIATDWPCIVADQLASCRKSSALNRAHPQSDLELGGSKLPVRFRRTGVRSAVQASKQMPNVVVPTIPPKASPSLVPAHHYFHLVYQTFRRWMLDYTSVKYRIENFLALSLGVIQNSYFAYADAEVASHYSLLGSRNLQQYKS